MNTATSIIKCLLPVVMVTLSACEKDDLSRNNVLDQDGIYGESGYGYATIADGVVSGVYANGALFEGEVYHEGIVPVYERGVCFNYSGNPSVNYYTISAGAGAGGYECVFDRLIPGYTYYLRAYAKNQKGITYGRVLSFTTPIQ
jgi:hypothetical protein